MAANSGDKKKKVPTMGPIRTNLEAFGVAILAAVLLKWFCIEAYQIPTSSMQPTLMGDQASKVFDRILVNKLLQTFREPQRWDITVFKYPLQKNQNYVKRIVGMPGDWLHIAGGNVYQVSEADGQRTYTPLRKPDDLQEDLWKEVYPARRLVRNESEALGKTWRSSPSKAFEEQGEEFTTELRGNRPNLLRFVEQAQQGQLTGFIDHDWDGYPTAVAQAIREKTVAMQPPEIVPDGRLAATFAGGNVDELALAFHVSRKGHEQLTFALIVTGKQGRLVVQDKSDKVLLESEAFDVALGGDPVRLAFAHVDDRMIAWVDGSEVQRIDCEQFDCREGCAAQGSFNDWRFTSDQKVVPEISCSGEGMLTIRDLVLERDLHYTRYQAPELIKVPEGHYYMMGDNTLQSIDSRGWTAITVGVTDDGRIVPPDTPGARRVRGNKRAMNLQNPPDRDETPIPIPSENAIVMIDEYGEILRLEGQAADGWADGGQVIFRSDDGTEWQAEDTTNTRGVSFVPRADIQGRALMVFYPVRPFSWLLGENWPDRFGTVR